MDKLLKDGAIGVLLKGLAQEKKIIGVGKWQLK